jgi:hypothetical protein
MSKVKKKPAAKPIVKAKPASKAPAKAAKPAKPLKKVAKPAKPAKDEKPLAKKIGNAIAKVFGKGTAQEVKPAKPAVEKLTKSAKPAKASKKAKKAQGEDLEDDLLAGDEIGSEEIPDLADFVEDEEPEIEIESDSGDGEEVQAKPTGDEEIVLTDAEGRRYCRVRDCDQAAVVDTYCRFHYLQLWKKIQVRRKILIDGKLARYVEELTSRYPDKFLEVIKRDLRSEKDFLGAIAELEIDESANEDSELEDEAQNFIDEVRGMATTEPSMSDDDDF